MDLRPRPTLLLLPLLAVGVLAPALPARARAPSTSETLSLDWLREKLEKERQEDETAAKQVPPLQAKATSFGTGEMPLDQWKEITDGIKDPKERPHLREFATTKFIERARKDNDRVDARVLRKFKEDACRELLPLIVQDDLVGQQCVFRLLQEFAPKSGVEWKPSDSKARRTKAYRDLLRYFR